MSGLPIKRTAIALAAFALLAGAAEGPPRGLQPAYPGGATEPQIPDPDAPRFEEEYPDGIPRPPKDLPTEATGEPAPLSNEYRPADPDVASSPSPPDARVVPAAPPVLGSGGSSIQVGTLGSLEGPLAGTLDEASGGLGTSAWEGSDRATVETLLNSAPATSTSAVQRLMLRKVLMSIAPPPSGRSETSFHVLRIRKLLEGGYLDDAAAIAAQVRVKDDSLTARAQADALLYAGRDEEACGEATVQRLQSAEPFWIELRAYCYAASSDAGALALTRSVMEAQGAADTAFFALLDRATAPPAPPPRGRGQAAARASPPPELSGTPTALRVRLLERAKLPMTPAIATGMGAPGSLVALRSAETPLELRLAAADSLFRAGALSAPQLGQTLDLYAFKPEELQAAAAQARAEGSIRGLARLRAALKLEAAHDQRAELVYTAFRIGESERILPLVAELFAPDAAATEPAPEWDNWAVPMAHALVLAGNPDAAERWYDILDPGYPDYEAAQSRIALVLAIAAPSPSRVQRAQPALQWQVAETQNGQQPVMAMGALALGAYDALGRPMPYEARAPLGMLLELGLPGRRPPRALLTRIDEASLANRRGELLVSVMNAVGPRGPGDIASEVNVGMIRALRTSELNDVARALAVEAIVTRPASG